jgi:hypothetical protein
MQLFKNAKELDNQWTLVDANYSTEPKKIAVKKVEPVQEIDLTEEPEINTEDFTVKTFTENLANFTEEELQVFLTDSRKSIVKLAQKQLKSL